MNTPLTREQVLAHSSELPAFPRVIQQIIATLDDPDANLTTLVEHIEHDPVITGRVLSLANRAGAARRSTVAVNDVFTATSLIGLSRVRETVITSCLADFVSGMEGVNQGGHFWQHSVAVGVCSMEIAKHAPMAVCVDSALVSGLLHDVGQLWLIRFAPQLFHASSQDALKRGVDWDVTERERFGVDHARIGAWLASGWGLSDDIVSAIAQHHALDHALAEPLVAVVHVAEVLSHALNLAHCAHSRVTTLSAASCAQLDLTWGEGSQALFGRLEARCKHAGAFFR